MSLSGCLIAESLGVGGAVTGVGLTVTKVSRAEAGDVEAGQPRIWTFIEFEVADEDGDELADILEGELRTGRGWYATSGARRKT